MFILHIASECAPIAKVGGLADVVFGLAKETLKHGHRVEIILPKYDCIDYSFLKDLKIAHQEIPSYDGSYSYKNTVWSSKIYQHRLNPSQLMRRDFDAQYAGNLNEHSQVQTRRKSVKDSTDAGIEGLTVWLLESHHPALFFNRGKIYGCPDDIDRFIYFSRAVLEFLFKTKKNPDVIHLHDWPTALIAPLYKEMYIPLGFKIGGTLLTIHNLDHQGKCSTQNITRAGLRGEEFLTPDKMQDPFQDGLINLLKGGIEYADFITTVSSSYEKEIQTIEGGCGLNTTLIKCRHKLKGILNGIDETYWNPQTDPYIASPYDLQNVSHGKEVNKTHLRKRFGLKESKKPLVCSITRLVPQKSPDLIKHALHRTLEKEGQFILLGASASPEIEKTFQELQNNLSKNKNVALHFEYDEPLAHLTYAGSDMIIVPSLYEPCGLTQMIALHYGTIPLVRKTGGLKDTVFDGKNGLTFDFPDTLGVNWVLDRALEIYAKDREKWIGLVERGMKQEVGWKKSACDYIEIYQKLKPALTPS